MQQVVQPLCGVVVTCLAEVRDQLIETFVTNLWRRTLVRPASAAQRATLSNPLNFSADPVWNIKDKN